MQEVGRCEKLQNVYQAGIVGSYGGGDAFRAARQIFVTSIPSPLASSDSQAKCSDTINEIMRDSWQAAKAAYNKEQDKDRDERIVNIPAQLVDKDAIRYDFKFQISTHLKDVEHYNMLYQGWLFHEDVLEEGRQGVSRWPLIGLYFAQNIRNNPMEPASVGINTLAFADQHVHLVEEILELDGFEIPLSDWHFGSDMAQFTLEPDSLFAQCWAVCLDLEKARCEISYLIIVNNEAIASLVEKHVKEKNPLENKATPAEFATELVDLLTKELAIPALMANQVLELLGVPQEPKAPMEIEEKKESEKENQERRTESEKEKDDEKISLPPPTEEEKQQTKEAMERVEQVEMAMEVEDTEVESKPKEIEEEKKVDASIELDPINNEVSNVSDVKVETENSSETENDQTGKEKEEQQEKEKEQMKNESEKEEKEEKEKEKEETKKENDEPLEKQEKLDNPTQGEENNKDENEKDPNPKASKIRRTEKEEEPDKTKVQQPETKKTKKRCSIM